MLPHASAPGADWPGGGPVYPVPRELLRGVKRDDRDTAVAAWAEFYGVCAAMEDPDAEWTAEEGALLFSRYFELRALGVRFAAPFAARVETLHRHALDNPYTLDFLEDDTDSDVDGADQHLDLEPDDDGSDQWLDLEDSDDDGSDQWITDADGGSGHRPQPFPDDAEDPRNWSGPRVTFIPRRREGGAHAA